MGGTGREQESHAGPPEPTPTPPEQRPPERLWLGFAQQIHVLTSPSEARRMREQGCHVVEYIPATPARLAAERLMEACEKALRWIAGNTPIVDSDTPIYGPIADEADRVRAQLRVALAAAQAAPVPPATTHEVYARPECVFNYCPYPDVCRDGDACQHSRPDDDAGPSGDREGGARVMRACDATVEVLRETDNPAVMQGDEILLHLIADRLGWDHNAWHTSRRVLRALSETPGPLSKGYVLAGNRRVLIFRLSNPSES